MIGRPQPGELASESKHESITVVPSPELKAAVEKIKPGKVQILDTPLHQEGFDDHVMILGKVHSLLKPLTLEERTRILKAVSTMFGIEPTTIID